MQICSDWTFFIASNMLPKYMNDVLHLSIRDIGTFNSMPWILKTVTSYAFGYAIDKSIARQQIGISNARKLAVFLGECWAINKNPVWSWEAENQNKLATDAFFFVDLYATFFLYSPASIFPGIFIVLASYAECNHILVVIAFMIAIAALGFVTCGLNINPLDLSPNYSATLMSFSNCAAALSGIMAPYTVGLLTTNVSDRPIRGTRLLGNIRLTV